MSLLDIATRTLRGAKASSEVVLAAMVSAIVAAMVVPLPEWALDIGIALNLAAGVALLVAALQAKEPLKLATFPTLLLFTTLFRLAMNVSSTRLALTDGHAGEIIQAFGDFVVRGNFVVGAVIFCILTLVQFLVVAKGAERVAEVSARFTLDAMPGKQMSIDADLRSGTIDPAAAKARRRELERESQLFGAMDGAMKFVKGDVIAGLVIALVNLAGGTVIGVMNGGMSFKEAAATYALIAIGDGLVSQLPSLCVAVAAGLVVTRVAGEDASSSLGAEIGTQFFGRPTSLWVVASVCGAMALMPGMPAWVFSGLAALLGFAAWAMAQPVTAAGAKPEPSASQPPSAAAAGLAEVKKDHAVGVSPIVVDLAADISPLAQGASFVNGDLARVHEQVYQQLGVRLPPIRVRTGAALPNGHYRVSIDEVPTAMGEVAVGASYVVAPPEQLTPHSIDAQPFKCPVTGKPSSRIDDIQSERARALGHVVRTARELMCEHVGQVLSRHGMHFVGIQEVRGALDTLETRSPALVREALAKVPLALLTDVLRRLVEEQVSIRNLRVLLDALVSPAAQGDAAALAEHCRQALSRQLSYQHATEGPLYAYLVDPAVEELLRQGGPRGAVDPHQLAAIIEGARRLLGEKKTVVLASPDVRRTLRKLLEGAFPQIAILTYAELDPSRQVRPMGRLQIA
ncbi:MAG: flagellar biosynthesis protein FlhA [Myxococcaceae bacterium]|nr:flagellar biosynthesis protein FlhA [Myxococcaceae bacterium]